MRKKCGTSRAVIYMSCGLLLTQLAGCGAQTKDTAAEQVTEQAAESVSVAEVSSSVEEAKTVSVTLGEGGSKSVVYEAEDVDADWDAQSAVGIVLAESGITVDGDGALADGNTVVIQKAGTYVLSGKMQDAQVRIEAAEGELVHLVLNGVELSSKTTASIYAPEKCKVILTLEQGTKNILSDAGAYQFEDGEDEPNATIFTKGDLSINGTGELEVNATYACAIRSKGDLKVVSGVLRLEAADDALKGKDSVVIGGGELNIVSEGDGIKSNNDKDEEKGYVWIDGGNIVIAAEQDGIQAEHALVINGGTIEITKSDEALEGKSVDIFGGKIQANASDDGINAAGPAETEWEKMQDQEGVYIHIAGGEIWLNANADGVDSNGDLYIDGGELYLSTPVVGDASIIDYNGTSRITGGTVVLAGGTMMMQYFGEDSTQNYLVNYYDETQTGGTQISLMDADGRVLASFAPEKDFQAVFISTPEINTGDTYQIVTGENIVEAVAENGKTEIGEKKESRPDFGGHGGRGPRPDGEGFPEGMTPPDGKEFPEGMTPPDGKEFPEGMTPPEGKEFSEGMTPPEGGAFSGKRNRPDGKNRWDGKERSDSKNSAEVSGDSEKTASQES